MVTPLLFALLVPLAAAEPPTKVCTGGVVFAECFGFNATDGTAALQVRPHCMILTILLTACTHAQNARGLRQAPA